jgi:hypothetical protein
VVRSGLLGINDQNPRKDLNTEDTEQNTEKKNPYSDFGVISAFGGLHHS